MIIDFILVYMLGVTTGLLISATIIYKAKRKRK